MTILHRIAFVGNSLPRRCGIATFTHDLHKAVAAARPGFDTFVVAMTDTGRTYDYPGSVRNEIRADRLGDYETQADVLNASQVDVVSLQHEYGIFGGDAGAYVLALTSRLTMPVVTTLHTVLPEPTPAQRQAMHGIIDVSAKLVVMAQKGREILRSVYGAPDRAIEVIPHGIPDYPFLGTERAKARLGFQDRKVILTFGLLSPSKGIEFVIDAMPAIVARCPQAVYVVLGATHPNLVRDQGEAYRERLMARVRQLGMESHVVFRDQFVDQPTLLDFISMCDVYVTPYLNEAQMTSGTLAYSFGLGKAVVSTPYWHARELLADGRGVLVPFADVQTLATEISALLTDDRLRDAMRSGAYAASRSMTWPQTAERYLTAFETAVTERRRAPARSSPWSGRVGRPTGHLPALPQIRTGHVLSLCDSTGMLQHAVHSVADRHHGYCVDDNARALLFSSALVACGEAKLPEAVTASFAAFIQHAWNPDAKRFRNFMSYDRRWLEDAGSEDSHARTLWALGECAAKDEQKARRDWARGLFEVALPAAAAFTAPRGWAFTLLGLDAYCKLPAANRDADRLRGDLADRLMSRLAATAGRDWHWFEDVLAYDNARLPQSLIRTGMATNSAARLEAGLTSLRWLTSVQTSPSGCFRPVGTRSFGQIRKAPQRFDQQPVEAAATIAACLAADRADRQAQWRTEARRAFDWFLGANDLGATLADPATGACCDGLHPDRPNENKGAESTLSYLLGLVEIRELDRRTALDRQVGVPIPGHVIRNSRIKLPITPGSCVAPIPISQPPVVDSAARSGASRGPSVQTRD